MPVVGTAGHVDHGKSTLIEALTGRDPDRWAEEKRRGLTIDIGFAWTSIDGRDISFVDVPGHERYLKNMLAGIEAIDAVLFVVAADEGWMPQSEEHLAVLDLLDIGRGVIALTKTDAVDRDTIDLAALEIEDRLAGTSLERVPIVPVSAVTGVGLDDLRRRLVEAIPPDPEDGRRPRLWVDRSFSIEGAGTVVTGTLLDGSITQGDTVTIFPEGSSARVRGLQSHEKEANQVFPARRVAVNLSGVDRSQTPRGAMLGLPGQWLTSSRFTARVRPARYVQELKARGDYQLHIGSGAHRVMISRIENEIAIFKLSVSLPIKTGDRFILRDTGRKLVVAGGRVLDPAPGPSSSAIRQSGSIDPGADPDVIATALLHLRGSETIDTLAAHSGGGRPQGAFGAGATAVALSSLHEILNRAEGMVRADHETHPLRSGLPAATLATMLGYSLDLVVDMVDSSEVLERVGPDVRVTDHTPGLSLAQEEAWAEARRILERGLDVPPAADLGLDSELIHLLVREEQLVRISSGMVLLPGQAKEIRAIILGMKDGFTVAEFRDASGLSRKYSVPFLEWADSEGITRRRGDLRHLR